MPIQDIALLPWEWLGEAEDERLEALRGDDPARQAAALADLEAARDAVRLLGTLLVLKAVDSRDVQEKLRKVFDGMARSAWDRARAAEARATRALQDLDALLCRVREVERLVERLAADEPTNLRLVR